MSKTTFIILVVISLALFMSASCDNNNSRQMEKKVQSQIADELNTFKGCLESNVLSEEQAFEALKVLAVGDHETINYYNDFEQSKESNFFESAESLYSNDVCTAVEILSRSKNPRAYGYILSIIEQKGRYPRAVVCAIRAVMIYGVFVDGYWSGDTRSQPSLMKVINSEDPEVRLNAAVALLSVEFGGIALPVLDEFIKAGDKRAIPAIDKLFEPEQKTVGTKVRIVRSETRLFDPAGKDLLIRTLDYPNNEVKVYAASKLFVMGIEKNRAEQTAISILKKLKDKKEDNYEEIDVWIQDRDATLRAVALLGEINSPAGNKLLKELTENDENKLLQERARSALKSIQQK